MSAGRAARLVRRQRRAISDRIEAEATRITYCTVNDSTPGVEITIEFEGADVEIPLAQLYCHKFPEVDDRVAVHVNGTELVVIGVWRV